MIKLFNALLRKKEIFRSIRGAEAGLYACGPTVYNYAHIGNLRTYIFEDILRRALEYNGYKVRHVMNITDIDDKIIHSAALAKKSIFEFTKKYETVFFDDLKKLSIKKAWKYPKATRHIKEILLLIDKLIQKKIAYISDDGVYFSIAKFKPYGKLSGIKSEFLKTGSRVYFDEYDKNHVRDFALWKFKKSGEPSWKAPFGEGRPGWHIECSAMSMKYLGAHFDIHTGGVDLVFPHHENEIAQSKSATGKKFANYFLEGEHLLVNGEKMSKSLGNIFTLRNIERRGVNPLAYRYLVLGAHYRSKLNFTWEALEASQKALMKLYEITLKLKNTKYPEKLRNGVSRTQSTKYLKEFKNAINDDLNTPKALAVLWKAAKHGDPSLLYEFDEILGLGLKKVRHSPIPRAILELIQKREKLRKLGNWVEADRIRGELKKKGYAVKDTPEGPKISPVSPLLP